MSVTLDTYRPGEDDAAVLALRTRVWGDGHPHTTEAFLDWLFRRNPSGVGSGILLRRKDQLIGFAGLSPRLANRDGRLVRVAHGLDFMIDPEATKGLAGAYAVKVADAWAKLAAREGFDFGINFPNSNSYRLLTSTRLGWQRVLAPRLLVRPLPGLRLREGLPTRVPPVLADIGLGVVSRGLGLYARTRHGSEEPIESVENFDWLPGPQPGAVGLVRDTATLKWRYCDHPVYRYTLLRQRGPDASVTGLVAAARTLFGVESTLIVDLVGDLRPDAAAALIGRAVADGRAKGSRIVGALACQGDLLDRTLLRLGFLPVPERINPKPFFMVAHGLGTSVPPSFPDAGWRFAWGDTDVV